MAEIILKDVTVNFSVYNGAGRSFRSHLIAATTGGKIQVKGGGRIVVNALDRVSCSIVHGDRVAIIGNNGAGKTTLLRVLAGIYVPFPGRVRIEGKIAPLFDTGFGMDMDATGHENIRLRSLYLGLSRKELESKINEIAEFCELGAFLDMPLRTYSAGMQTRLAFAVSTSIDPEILLLDEQIGAGDATFIAKAARRFEQLVERSGILILASHSDAAVRQFCTKGLVLENGRLAFIGSVDDALDRYHSRAYETPVRALQQA